MRLRPFALTAVVLGAGAFFFSTPAFVWAKPTPRVQPASALFFMEKNQLPDWIYGDVDVRRAHLAPGGPRAPLIIVFEDTHGHPALQRTISLALRQWVDKGHVTDIGVEGASGAFLLSPYRRFPDRVSLGDVADFLLKQNLLAGAEHAAWLSQMEPEIWGVENRGLYLANEKAYLDTLPMKQTLQDEVAEWDRVLGVYKERVFSSKLRDLDDTRERTLNGELSWGSYLRFLSTSTGLSLAPSADPLSQWPRLENTALLELLGGADERELWHLAQDAALLKRMTRFRLSSDEWDTYAENRPRLQAVPERLRHLVQKMALPATGIELKPGRSLDMATALKPYESYYVLTAKRSRALLDAFLMRVRTRPLTKRTVGEAAVLVVGAFHSDALCAVMRKRGISHVVVAPPTPAEPLGPEELFLRSSWERLFPVAGNTLAPPALISVADPLEMVSPSRHQPLRILTGALAGAVLRARGGELIPDELSHALGDLCFPQEAGRHTLTPQTLEEKNDGAKTIVPLLDGRGTPAFFVVNPGEVPNEGHRSLLKKLQKARCRLLTQEALGREDPLAVSFLRTPAKRGFLYPYITIARRLWGWFVDQAFFQAGAFWESLGRVRRLSTRATP